MKAPINDDNRYPKGTEIYARSNPDVKLLIKDYKARTYYCSVTGDELRKAMPYFERELVLAGERSVR